MTVDANSVPPPDPTPKMTPAGSAALQSPGLPEVPGYVLQSVLGRGGMGVVYKARDTRLHRDIALKMLTAGAFAHAGDVTRFRAEAEAIAALQHPNIVQVYEVGEVNGLPYFAMELVEGGTLHQLMSGQPLPPKRAAAIAWHLAQALQHAHERGIIHRDIKPANILLQNSKNQEPNSDRKPVNSKNQEPNSNVHGDWNLVLGSWNLPKVSDFGLAKRLDGTGAITETGTALGTPNYMAPEQATGRRDFVAPAIDIYALGAVLYEMLIGRPPFLGGDPIDVLLLVRSAEPIAPRKMRQTLPRDLETICLKCLQKHPSRRYATAAELADDLGRFLGGEPIKARPVGPLERAWKWANRYPTVAAMTAAIVVVTLTGLAGVLWQWREAHLSKLEAVAAHEATEAILYETRIAQAALLWDRNSADQAAQVLQTAGAERAHLRDWEWRYLNTLIRDRLAESSASDRAGLADAIGHQITVAADGRRIFVTSRGREDAADDHFRRGVFAAFDDQLRRVATGPAGDVRPGILSVAAVRGDGRAVTADKAGTVYLWDDKGREVRRWADWGGADVKSDGDQAAARNLAVSADGRWLARRQGDHAIELRDVDEDRVVARCVGHAARPVEIQFRDDGRQLLSRGRDGTARLWDRETGRQLGHWRDESGFEVMAPSPDGRWVALVPGNGTAVRVADARSGREILSLTPLDRVDRLQFSPDSRRAVATLANNSFQVWQVPEGGAGFPLLGHLNGATAMAFGPDGVTLITGGHGGEIHLWDLTDGKQLRTYRGHVTAVRSLAFSPDGRRIYSCDQRGNLFAWDATRDLGSLHIHHVESPEWCGDFQFSPDGGEIRIAGTLGASGYDAATGVVRWVRPLPLWSPVRYPRYDSAFSPDGTTLFAVPAGDRNVVAQWRLSDGAEIARYRGLNFEARAVAVSPDNQWLAACGHAAGNGGETLIWPAGGGDPVHRLPVAAMVLAFDGRGRLAMASVDATSRSFGKKLPAAGVRLFDPATGTVRLMKLRKGEMPYILGLAFSPDGRRLAATLFDQFPDNVAVWDAESGQLLDRLTTAESPVGVAYSPDGRRLAVNGYTARVVLWNTQSGGEVLVLPQANQRRDDYGYKAAVAFSPDGQRLAAIAPGGIYVWDAGVPGETEGQLHARRRSESDSAAALRAIGQTYRHMHAPFARQFHRARIGDPARLPPQLQVEYGRLMTGCGDWAASAEAFGRAGEARGLERADWYLRAAVRLLADGPAGYQRYCAELPDPLPGVAEPEATYHQLAARSLAPGGGSPELLRELLGRFESRNAATAVRPLLALAEWRAGRLGRWTERVEKAVAVKKDTEYPTALLVLALVGQSRGDAAARAKWLHEFRNWHARLPEASRRDGVMAMTHAHHRTSHEWAVVQVLYRELTGEPLPSGE